MSTNSAIIFSREEAGPDDAHAWMQYAADYSGGGLRPTGARDGASYIESLRDDREVWYDGGRVDVARHPCFAGMASELARLFDLQCSPELAGRMTMASPLTGRPVSLSYLAPQTREELAAKCRNTHVWMEASNGQLPRIPDFMANVVVGLYDYRDELGKVRPQFARNAENYYRYCREFDIVLTHAIGDPQINRSAKLSEHPDNALRVVERRADGVVVRGAKQLATLAPYCHEVLVYISPAFFHREAPEYVIWFSLPIATPGLKLMCRESQVERRNGFRHDFASRYDEQDAMLFFDDVFIPNHRIFLLDDVATAVRGFPRVSAWALQVGQIRFYHRLRVFLGVASLVAQSTGVSEFREISGMLGELTSYVELIRLALAGLESDARTTAGGLVAPAVTLAMDSFAAQVSSRVTEIIRVVGGSGLVMQPSERDLACAELRPFLDKYMCGKEVGVDFKARLFRLATELVCDSYGMRQELYEMWNRGDIVRNRIALYGSYPDRPVMEARVRQLLENASINSPASVLEQA